MPSRHIMDRFSQIRRVLIFTLVLNWLVAFSKIAYGSITRCASMTADGFHSFGDGASNIIGIVGIWAAARPRDQEHPYGHKKFETMATLGIAAILFVVAFNIIKEAFLRIAHPVVPNVTALSFLLMVITVGVNIFVMNYERNKGDRLSSDILICDSFHTRSDVLVSLVVIGTLISIKIGFSFLDIIVATSIALLIGKTGLDILRASSNVLCDANVIADSMISEIVKGIAGVSSVHKIRSRGRRDDVHVDLHVIIDANLHVNEAHKINHRIASILKERIKGITDVSIHMEPGK